MRKSRRMHKASVSLGHDQITSRIGGIGQQVCRSLPYSCRPPLAAWSAVVSLPCTKIAVTREESSVACSSSRLDDTKPWPHTKRYTQGVNAGAQQSSPAAGKFRVLTSHSSLAPQAPSHGGSGSTPSSVASDSLSPSGGK